jgi:membrane-associated phospholipid phosphatase
MGSHDPRSRDGAGGSPPVARRGQVPRPLLLTHGIWQPRSLLRFAAAGAVLATLWTAVGLLLVSVGPPAADQRALELAVRLQDPALVPAARFVSWVGDLPVVSAVALVVVAIAYRRSRRWDLGWLTLAVIGGALAVTATVKGITDRARPDGGLTDTFSSAFPSGHAVRAAAVYALVTWLVLRWTSPDRRLLRTGTAVVAVTMTLAIGASRMLLGAHWLTDVVGGYVLGVLWLAVCVAVTRPHRVLRSAASDDPPTTSDDPPATSDDAPATSDDAPATSDVSGTRVDDQGQDRTGALATAQQPRRDGEGPAGAPEGVDEQDRPRR